MMVVFMGGAAKLLLYYGNTCVDYVHGRGRKCLTYLRRIPSNDVQRTYLSVIGHGVPTGVD